MQLLSAGSDGPYAEQCSYWHLAIPNIAFHPPSTSMPIVPLFTRSTGGLTRRAEAAYSMIINASRDSPT